MDGGDRALPVGPALDGHRHLAEPDRRHLAVPDPACLHGPCLLVVASLVQSLPTLGRRAERRSLILRLGRWCRRRAITRGRCHHDARRRPRPRAGPARHGRAAAPRADVVSRRRQDLRDDVRTADVNVLLDEEPAREAVTDPGVELLWWGRKLSGVQVALADADRAVVEELLDEAWRRRRRRS